ncbi:unnamed protein product, partial [Rotaria sordida]
FLDSLSSSLSDIEMTDVDKTPSNDTENDENDKLDETDPRNIWRKRRKLSNNNKMSSMIQTELINNNQIKTTNEPHDHQLPIVIPVHHDYLMDMSNIGYPIHNQFSSLPLKRQSLITGSYSIEQLQQLY